MPLPDAVTLPGPRAADVPASMAASVYRGESSLRLEEVPVPQIGPGELLVRVEACGVCHTDLKKIEHDLLPPPRIYGHETSGVVVQAAPGAHSFAEGDRVSVFHHIPCKNCFYCSAGDYAQCEGYKKVGVTAGFEPAGGGFSQYVRVMDWIAAKGVEKIPQDVDFDRATFVEPVNTCLKGLQKLAVRPEETVVIQGQGPIGLIFTMLLRRHGVERVYATDPLPFRRQKALELGAVEAWDPLSGDLRERLDALTEGRGADAVIVAASAPGIVEQAAEITRPGARIMLFAQTSPTEVFQLDGAQVGKGERMVFGSYSASVDLQRESADTVWDPAFRVDQLVSDRLPLRELERGIEIARRPESGSLKVVVHPPKEQTS